MQLSFVHLGGGSLTYTLKYQQLKTLLVCNLTNTKSMGLWQWGPSMHILSHEGALLPNLNFGIIYVYVRVCVTIGNHAGVLNVFLIRSNLLLTKGQ